MTDVTGVDARQLAAVEQAHRDYYQAWEDGDVARACALWLDSDDLSCTYPGIAAATGRDGVHELVSDGIRLTAGVQFLFEDVSVAVDGDLARLTCVENVVMPGAATLEEVVDLPSSRLSVTSIFRLVPAGWRLWSHHSGPILDQEGSDGR